MPFTSMLSTYLVYIYWGLSNQFIPTLAAVVLNTGDGQLGISLLLNHNLLYCTLS